LSRDARVERAVAAVAEQAVKADALIDDVIKDCSLNDSLLDDLKGLGRDILGGLSSALEFLADLGAVLVGLREIWRELKWPFGSNPGEVSDAVTPGLKTVAGKM
jgi:hypothetical protein